MWRSVWTYFMAVENEQPTTTYNTETFKNKSDMFLFKSYKLLISAVPQYDKKCVNFVQGLGIS